MSRMEIGFVCTNYNNSHFTRAAVESLIRGCGACPIIVVDNGSGQDSIRALEELERSHENVTLVFSDKNVGYFRGLNIGIRAMREAYPAMGHIVVGNNDLVFPADFCDRIRECAACFERSAVVSPDVVTLDGVHQNPHVIESISWMRELLYDLYYTSYALARSIRWLSRVTRRFTDRADESHWDVSGPIYQGHGSCYVLGPLFFDNFDELWAPSFLMGEEWFLSKQLKDVGMQVYYEPRIRVEHRCHGAVGQMPDRTMWEHGRDAHRVYRAHVGVFGQRV